MKQTDVPSYFGYIISTQSGRCFDFSAPSTDDICITDIANALGNTCRFGGHCSKFYSVAEHCCHCYDIATEENYDDAEFHMAVLMHDAAEAYTGDMPRPLKNMMPEFKKLEADIESIMEKKFCLDLSKDDKIKDIDYALLKAEKRVLFIGDERNWKGLSEIRDVQPDFKFYEPTEATNIFLVKFILAQKNRL